jgi:DNA modification methylase
MTGREVSVRSGLRTKHSPTFNESRCQLITGNALTELPKLQAKAVNVVLTSPPYWPSRRTYGGKGIGFENSLAQYVEILSQCSASRVVCFVMMVSYG